MREGRLELIIGPMFSGKSTKLIEISNRYESIGKNILNINHISDKRYGENVISSHSLIQKRCVSYDRLLHLLETDEFNRYDIIIIEEGQFFDDLVDFVVDAVDKYKKHVIVAGLSGDYKRQKFGYILDLIPMADKIEKLSAFCKLCNDGTEAHFTHRREVSDDTSTKDSNSVVFVGNDDIYEPVCRKHYIENSL